MQKRETHHKLRQSLLVRNKFTDAPPTGLAGISVGERNRYAGAILKNDALCDSQGVSS